MTGLAVSQNALIEIARIVREAKCHAPVLVLTDGGPAIDVSPSIAEALLTQPEGDVATQYVEDARRRASLDSIEWTLEVAAFERADCDQADLFRVAEFEFAITAAMRAALEDYKLDFGGGRFFLQSSSEIAQSLHQVKTLQGWFKPPRGPHS
jgi:hypothetical protein